MKVVDKYLARYAEPEHARAAEVRQRFERVIVVPARAESVCLLDGYRAALARKGAPNAGDTPALRQAAEEQKAHERLRNRPLPEIP